MTLSEIIAEMREIVTHLNEYGWPARIRELTDRLAALEARADFDSGPEQIVAWLWHDSMGGTHVTTSEEHANEIVEDCGVYVQPLIFAPISEARALLARREK